MELLLESKQVITIAPAFSKLHYGFRNEKEKNKILSYWKLLPNIKLTEGTFIESADFANKNNYHHIGIGLIDSILAKATIDNNYLIWTLEKKFLITLTNNFYTNLKKYDRIFYVWSQIGSNDPLGYC